MSLVSASYSPEGRFFPDAYMEARRLFAHAIGIAPTYQAIVDWNDAFTTTKDGKKIFRRTVKEVHSAFARALEAAAEKERVLAPA